MPLSADTLLDRLHLKQQISRWRMLAIVALVLAALVVAQQYGGGMHSPIEKPYIARLTVEGTVLDDTDRDALLDDVRTNPKIRAVIVRLDTPGGSTVGGMEVYRQLRAIAAEKPVVAVMRDLSASAGYLIALGTDRIFAAEGTLTGSIGVIVQAAEFTGLGEKLGITPITVKSGPMKDALSPFSKSSPEQLAAIQTVVDDFYQVFVDTVAERRKLPRDEVLKLADGRIFTGRQAARLKLIDALGGQEDALAWLRKERNIPADLEVRDVKVEKHRLPEFLEQFSDTIFRKITPGGGKGLDGLVSIWHPGL